MFESNLQIILLLSENFLLAYYKLLSILEVYFCVPNLLLYLIYFVQFKYLILLMVNFYL